MVKDFREHIKQSKDAEINFRNEELGHLRAEATKIDSRLQKLFNMRLDDEITKEQYEDKRDELTLKKNRIESEIKAHGEADDGFNENRP